MAYRDELIAEATKAFVLSRYGSEAAKQHDVVDALKHDCAAVLDAILAKLETPSKEMVRLGDEMGEQEAYADGCGAEECCPEGLFSADGSASILKAMLQPLKA